MTPMIKPKHLKPGDRIALIAPSSPVDEDKLMLSFGQSVKIDDPLEETAREGARQMLAENAEGRSLHACRQVCR